MMNRRLQHESLENRQMLTGVSQISGIGVFDSDGICADYQPDEEYGWFTMVMTGDLQGCWYTKTPEYKDNGQPSGIYQERGEEMFVELDDSGEPTGDTFKTTYFFNSKYDPAFSFVNEDGEVEYGAEVHGRCQHRIVEGTGDFEGATGWIFFKDDVDAGVNPYRGHIKFSNGGVPNHNAVDAAIAASLEADDESQDALS